MNEDRRFNRPLTIRHPDFDLASEQKLVEVLQELEGLSTDFNAEDFASETTLSALKTAFDIRDLATESTLEAARLLLLSLDGKDYATELTLDFFRSDFNSRDISTSAKQDDIINELVAVNLELDAQSVRLDSLDSKDYATESSLSDLNSKFNTLGQKTTVQSHPVVLSSEQEVLLESIKTAIEDSPTGLATEATLSGLRSDFNLEDFASQATLELIRLLTVSVDSKLNSLGQKNKIDSVPVTLSSDEDNLSINLNDESGNNYSNQNPLPTSTVSNLVSEEHDSIELTYVAPGSNGEGEIETATYKNGATVVATLTLSYDAQGRIVSITRS